MSDIQKIMFRCHGCRMKVAIGSDKIGSNLTCPKCKSKMQVPDHNALDDPAASKPEKIRFRCFSCEAKISMPPKRAGEEFPCPKCKAELIVPAKSTTDLNASKVRPTQDELEDAFLSEDDSASFDSSSGDDSAEFATPAGAIQHQESDSTEDKEQKTDTAATPSAPPGKKVCPDCDHTCPSFARACPFCQHEFAVEAPAKKPKRELSAEQIERIRQEQQRKLDSSVKDRREKAYVPVEEPLWMNYSRIKPMVFMVLSGLGLIITSFFCLHQLNSQGDSAFFLFRILANIGSKWLPFGLCLIGGIALVFFGVRALIPILTENQNRFQDKGGDES